MTAFLTGSFPWYLAPGFAALGALVVLAVLVRLGWHSRHQPGPTGPWSVPADLAGVAIDVHTDHTTIWLCEPPAPGARYRVVRARWDGIEGDENAVRYIHEWGPA